MGFVVDVIDCQTAAEAQELCASRILLSMIDRHEGAARE
jgi:hypothetical protein